MASKSFSTPKPIFRGKVIATAGSLPDDCTAENCKRWIKLRKGEFTDVLDERVTHFLCTEEQYNDRVPLVKTALKLKKCFVLDYRWFILSMGGIEQRQAESKYNFRRKLEKELRQKKRQMQLEKGRVLENRFVNPNFFRIYTDRLVFDYEVEITRRDENSEQAFTYILFLYESIAKPSLYWFAVKCIKQKGDRSPCYYRTTDYPTQWQYQMNEFKAFFKLKTGISWEERLIRQGTMPAEFFQYTPPTRGKPLGRRKLFSRSYCLELNKALRGLPQGEDVEESEKEEAVENNEDYENNTNGGSGAEIFFDGEMEVDSAGGKDGEMDLDSGDGDESNIDAMETPMTELSSDEADLAAAKDDDIDEVCPEVNNVVCMTDNDVE